MRLDTLDWIVLALYGIVCVAIGLAVVRRAGQGRHEFFLSGRRLSWWLLGVSLVATTFSTDTPNLVTDLVRTGGVSQNWVWWAFAVTVLYAASSGLSGVVLTDFVQFVIAMVGSVMAAVVALGLPQVGGLTGLFAHPAVAGHLSLLPDFSDWSTAAAVLVVPLAVQWWSTWYPGAEPGGGGYVAQRMLASLAAAYMSTISTHLNWGASYAVEDCYRRFVAPHKDERHYVRVGRAVTVLLIALASALSLWLQNSYQAFQILLQIGAGTGLIFLLRWFWWRVNAWSEIAGMMISFVVAVYFQFVHRALGLAPLTPTRQLVIGVAITTVGWLAVTFATPPTDRATLQTFYDRIR